MGCLDYLNIGKSFIIHLKNNINSNPSKLTQCQIQKEIT